MDGISSLNSNAQYYVSSTALTSSQAVSAAASTNSASQVIINTGKRKQEIADFTDALAALKTSLKDFNGTTALSGSSLFSRMYEEKSSEAFRTMSYTDAKKIITAYNQLNDVAQSSGFMTSEAKRMLSFTKDFLLGGSNSAKFANMGITVDSSSGDIKLSKTKFNDFVANDPDTVYDMLNGKHKLVESMRNIIDMSANHTDLLFHYPVDAKA